MDAGLAGVASLPFHAGKRPAFTWPRAVAMDCRRLIIGMFVLGVPMLALAEGPPTGALPPDYGVISRPPAPPAGEAARGWIFMSCPDHYKTPLYHLVGVDKDGPSVTILIWPNVDDARRAFDLAPRVTLSIQGTAPDQFVSVASGDIVPVSGRLVKFERTEFPSDYPRESIPKGVMDCGLRWTDVTDSVSPEVRPGEGWPLVMTTSDPEKQSGQHSNPYLLFPDPRIREKLDQQFFVRVADITGVSTGNEKPRAEFEIIEKSPLEQKTVGRMSVQQGEFIRYDNGARRVLKIPRKAAGDFAWAANVDRQPAQRASPSPHFNATRLRQNTSAAPSPAG
jgi:hypothetical protein